MTLLELQFYFREDAEAVRRLLAAVLRARPDLWREEPADRFGPGELILHLIQTGDFALWFVRQQLRLEPTRELEPSLQAAAFDRRALARLYFEEARRDRRRFPDATEFTSTVRDGLRQIDSRLTSLPVDRLNETVSHPLVHLKGPAIIVLTKLFVRHWPYHLGQLSEQLKAAGCASHVPFLPHFGFYDDSSRFAAVADPPLTAA